MATENSAITADMLRKYLTKSQAWGSDNNKLADFRDAQAYYSQAIEALGDYDKVDPELTDLKQTILFTGTTVAMRAVNSFEHVIARYHEEFREDKANNNKEFVIPGTDDPEVARKLESYHNLAINIRDLTPDIDLWLKKFSLGYKKSGAEATEHWEDVKITERGLKIYHLKSLIDYCEIMIKGINILAADNHAQKETAKDINYFFEKGSGCLTGLLYLYDKFNLGNADPKKFTTTEFADYCKKCTNMFRYLMSALILLEDPDIQVGTMDALDLAATLMNYKKYPSTRKLNEFEDNLLKLFIVHDENDVDSFDQPGKLIYILDRAVEIAQDMKRDITDAIATTI